jgi:arginine/lysine/ornithine decarboxylase
LLTLCEPGDIIIVQRNVHKSIINGLKLAGAKAVFLSPQIEEHSGLAIIPALQQVEDALQLYPDAKAVFLSNPNYYGISTDLTSFAELVHRHGKPLIVDEAHGAHYGFHPELPRSGLASGADAVVQSAHKTLPTLTMGAMLHVQGPRIQRDLLRQSLAMIQSSSPSFPILASLDISRAMIDTLGAKMFEQSLASAASFRTWMELHSTAIRVMERPIRTANLHFVDPLRVVLYDNSGVLSGFELQRRLEEHGCFAEMADPRYVVLVFGIQTSLEDTMKLQHAIKRINEMAKEQAKAAPNKQSTLNQTILPGSAAMSVSEPVSLAREQFKNKSSLRVELGNAMQLLSAEMVTPYPPGIAILYPGEKITTAIIKQIQFLSASGAKFQGATDPTMSTIAVYSS